MTAVTDSPGGVAQDAYSYEPYGVTTINGTVANPWQFASGYHDTTNWYKFGMRYYAARFGRWSQLDSKEQLTDPVQADRYAYAGNDPVNHVDPTGQCILGFIGTDCFPSYPGRPPPLPAPVEQGLTDCYTGALTGLPFAPVTEGNSLVAGCVGNVGLQGLLR